MCSKFTIKTPFKTCSSVSISNFEQTNTGWVFYLQKRFLRQSWLNKIANETVNKSYF